MWFPQCTSPGGGLNQASVDGHKAIASFCPRGGKKLTASKPSSFFFPLSVAVESVCAMYRSAVRQPFTILKWSRFLKGTIRKKKWSKLPRLAELLSNWFCWPTWQAAPSPGAPLTLEKPPFHLGGLKTHLDHSPEGLGFKTLAEHRCTKRRWWRQ